MPKPNDTLASSGAPPYAIRSWTNGRDLFIEIPGKKGPYIETVNFNHRGIAHLFTIHSLHRIDGDYLSTIPEGYGKSNFMKGDAVDRAMADKILAQMGLLK